LHSKGKDRSSHDKCELRQAGQRCVQLNLWADRWPPRERDAMYDKGRNLRCGGNRNGDHKNNNEDKIRQGKIRQDKTQETHHEKRKSHARYGFGRRVALPCRKTLHNKLW